MIIQYMYIYIQREIDRQIEERENIQINQHRTDSNKYEYAINYNKSTVELKHFNLHKLKSTKIEMLKIHKNIKECLFLEFFYMRYYNTIYPF